MVNLGPGPKITITIITKFGDKGWGWNSCSNPQVLVRAYGWRTAADGSENNEEMLSEGRGGSLWKSGVYISRNPLEVLWISRGMDSHVPRVQKYRVGFCLFSGVMYSLLPTFKAMLMREVSWNSKKSGLTRVGLPWPRPCPSREDGHRSKGLLMECLANLFCAR